MIRPKRDKIVATLIEELVPQFRIDESLRTKLATKESIPIEKGVTLSEQFIEKNYSLFTKYASYFTAYPDRFLDLLVPADSGFSLFFYQRIFLRAIMRYRDIYIVAPRGFGKSFLTILGLFVQCIFFPGTKRFITAPVKAQGARIGTEKMAEIFDIFPLLRGEVQKGSRPNMPGTYGPDYIQLKFRNGSVLDVVGAKDSTRGGRRHGFEQRRRLLKNLKHYQTN